MWNKIPAFLKNKYLIASLLFVVWMFFFDRNSLMQKKKYNKTITELEEVRDFYISEIEKDSITMHILSSDTATLIRFAREEYLMKKDDEDVYVIIEKKADTTDVKNNSAN